MSQRNKQFKENCEHTKKQQRYDIGCPSMQNVKTDSQINYAMTSVLFFSLSRFLFPKMENPIFTIIFLILRRTISIRRKISEKRELKEKDRVGSRKAGFRRAGVCVHFVNLHTLLSITLLSLSLPSHRHKMQIHKIHARKSTRCFDSICMQRYS